ncbi:RcpC/CpaB family pilus assembly protein [Grimontia sp. SpTr1]|uniref:RcpC/CpaB family pilus assembly protein n=1 Tax=Grimontia sp. SpTr1 TaxID=2995319 RepID=UPI00248CD281|nr:RcpC/CpaB family pilus assembly protein [Grimontia sp. SpTr1]
MSSRFVFILAFIAIFFAAVSFLVNRPAPVITGQTPAPKEVAEPVSLWVAGETISPKQPVSSQLLVRKAFDAKQANMMGFTSNQSLDWHAGALFTASIKAGEVVRQNHIINPDAPDYIDWIITVGHVAYPLELPSESPMLVNLTVGDHIDIVTLTSPQRNLAEEEVSKAFRTLQVAPLLSYCKVLAVKAAGKNAQGQPTASAIVVELSRQQVAKLLVAKRVGDIEIFRSAGIVNAEQTQAETRDVLSGHLSVTELRGVARPASSPR